MANVTEHGIEVLKKAAIDIGDVPGQDYAFQIMFVEPGTNPKPYEHGIETIKKAAVDIGTTPKKDYALQVVVVGDSPTIDSSVVKARKRCAETISALKVVKADSATTISLASSNSTNLVAQGLGVALQAGLFDDQIDVLYFGQLDDASFNFTLNAPLFLGLNGAITETPPVVGICKKIGHSLGLGSIFININQTVVLAP